jgi:hypothetical protein
VQSSRQGHPKASPGRWFLPGPPGDIPFCWLKLSGRGPLASLWIRRPWFFSKWLANSMLMKPVVGTPPRWPCMSSFTPAASFVKSTVAKNGLRSPFSMAASWWWSRQAASYGSS